MFVQLVISVSSDLYHICNAYENNIHIIIVVPTHFEIFKVEVGYRAWTINLHSSDFFLHEDNYSFYSCLFDFYRFKTHYERKSLSFTIIFCVLKKTSLISDAIKVVIYIKFIGLSFLRTLSASMSMVVWLVLKPDLNPHLEIY